MSVKVGLPPIADPSTRLFILGSLPGEKSLAEQRYYAHPRNQFWKLVGAVIGKDLHEIGYDSRIQSLRKHGIGLWDVVSAARREGSLDAAIRDAQHNDIGGLKRDFPLLKAIAFNGGKAAKDGLKLLSGGTGLRLYFLPSSSPAYASLSLVKKSEVWMQLRETIG